MVGLGLVESWRSSKLFGAGIFAGVIRLRTGQHMQHLMLNLFAMFGRLSFVNYFRLRFAPTFRLCKQECSQQTCFNPFLGNRLLDVRL